MTAKQRNELALLRRKWALGTASAREVRRYLDLSSTARLS